MLTYISGAMVGTPSFYYLLLSHVCKYYKHPHELLLDIFGYSSFLLVPSKSNSGN